VTVNHDDRNEDAQFEALLERSSLGAPGARQLRERIPLGEAETIIRLSAPPPTSMGSPEEFFMRYWPRLSRFLISQASDSSLAEDVASEAFIAALENWDMLLRYERPDSWLFKVAIRKLRRLEAKARERSGPNGDLFSNEADLRDAAVMDEWMADHLTLTAAVRTLPRRQAEVIACGLVGYTARETAEILGISVAAVKTYLIEARKRLLVLLQVDPGPSDAMRTNPTVTPEDALRAAARTISRMPEADIQRKFAQLQEA
jgi:RNA polymerase sigma factor (sigma-70 family)